MASDEQRPDEPTRAEEPRPRPLVSRLAPRPGDSPDRLRLNVRVPPLVQKLLRATGRSAEPELQKVIGQYFRKITPERGPVEKGTYPGEVRYFERLLITPAEALTLTERLFVTTHQAYEALCDLAREASEAGDEETQREAEAAAAELAPRVEKAQELVRRERGEDAPEADWKASEP